MTITEERQSHLAHLMTDAVWNDDLVDYSDDDAALRTVKIGVANFVKECEALDAAVVKTIESLKRNVVPNSPEWDILYQKYYEEELKRRGEN